MGTASRWWPHARSAPGAARSGSAVPSDLLSALAHLPISLHLHGNQRGRTASGFLRLSARQLTKPPLPSSLSL